MLSISNEIRELLSDNATRAKADPNFDPIPHLKLFTPWARCTWLITESDSKDPNLVYGLADLGNGEPEFGAINLHEILSLTGPQGMLVEVDKYWEPKHPISVYIENAQKAGRIIF
ncbi:hypothetical protein GCM10019059_36030 [Camelimonas fluminis]|uniref:DUF2958 domain-containing protein n=1 Tax=Camelimonas fluminis TaxID=1576911 RepID=A0ABV7UHF1_9HYPH|nr:DUF2958 domain-containing protein [Camelimonas fluminis]GHE73244.1 hypothetical protein GCM10019059_36030 [Camelimonas fluminis]